MNKLAVLSLVTLCFVACGSPVVLDTPNGEVGADVDGGDGDGSTGGNSSGGNSSGGSSSGGNSTGGSTAGGSSGGSSTGGSSTGGQTSGGHTSGGSTSGDNCDGGSKPVCVPAERCDVCTGSNKCKSHVSNGCGGFYDCSTDKECGSACVPKKTKELCNGYSCQTVKDGCGGILFCGHALECQSCDRKYDRCVDACNAQGSYCHPDCKKDCAEDLKCCRDKAND